MWALDVAFSQEALTLLQQLDIRLFSGNEIKIHEQSQIYDFQESAKVIHLPIKYFPSYCIPNWDYLLDHKVSNKTVNTSAETRWMFLCRLSSCRCKNKGTVKSPAPLFWHTAAGPARPTHISGVFGRGKLWNLTASSLRSQLVKFITWWVGKSYPFPAFM